MSGRNWLCIAALLALAAPHDTGAMQVHSTDSSSVCQSLTNLVQLSGADHAESVIGPWLAGVLAGAHAEAMARDLADYDPTPAGFGQHQQWLAFTAYCRAHPMVTQLAAGTAVWEQVRERGRLP